MVHAMTEVLAQKLTFNPGKDCAGRINLRHDVDTVWVCPEPFLRCL